MDFFRILNAAFSILAWVIVAVIIWALYPFAGKALTILQGIHDFAR